jgi:hypothetical protein
MMALSGASVRIHVRPPCGTNLLRKRTKSWLLADLGMHRPIVITPCRSKPHTEP